MKKQPKQQARSSTRREGRGASLHRVVTAARVRSRRKSAARQRQGRLQMGEQRVELQQQEGRVRVHRGRNRKPARHLLGTATRRQRVVGPRRVTRQQRLPAPTRPAMRVC
jgi:hypothetical protein